MAQGFGATVAEAPPVQPSPVAVAVIRALLVPSAGPLVTVNVAVRVRPGADAGRWTVAGVAVHPWAG
ncbi:hypothetical protein [Microbispora catharanthi]|uniref:Uncharacterized protein n=1 Tax=Microbispora catharanthi TaxID=1712871 RepID=A0A5N6B152_9ACTN|nr:hypothetical protein [Microbispora catharanthi]KAB8174032.1 hypothetical protein FH610_040970 [Microbispora catharanthi]